MDHIIQQRCNAKPVTHQTGIKTYPLLEVQSRALYQYHLEDINERIETER